MDFFNKIGNMASETYKKTSKKTGDLAKEAKIRMQMNEAKASIKDLYEEIGKVVYQKHIKEEEISIKEDLDSYCTQIDELSEKVEKYLDEVLKIRGKRFDIHSFHIIFDSGRRSYQSKISNTVF